MNINIQSIAVIGLALALASCGTSTADKETTTNIDTSSVAVIDTAAIVPMTTDTGNSVAVNVPANTKKVFEEKYPKATKVKWESNKKEDTKSVEWDLNEWPETEESGHNAWFHWQGNDSKAYYDEKSNWVGTVDEISDPKSLPAAVTSAINKQFGGYTVTSVKRENDKNRTAYEVTLEKGAEKIKALIHENGSLVKQKKVK